MNKVREKIKSQKGVTLVSLVVTIIVLIILVTVAVNATMNEGGLLDKVLGVRDENANTIENDDERLSEMSKEYANMMQEKPAAYIDNSLIKSPKVDSGMTPVKWNGTNWVKTTTTDPEWYNYVQKKWANVVLGDATFDETTGVLDESKAYSMLVWIPRYAYKITSGWHQDSTDLSESGGAGTISVVFIDTNNRAKDGTIYDATYAQATVDAETTHQMSQYVQHPAFTFGTDELEGFWVGKYESSNTDGATGYDESYVMQIKPNVTSWRDISVNDIYSVCRNMNRLNNPYKLPTSNKRVDPHMMKNTEWGAVAYLSKSSYGKETEEVYINNSSLHITGTAGATASEAETGTSYAYPNSNAASTTGNIYGVFDMSGGAWEYAAGYINNSYIQDTTSEQYINGKNLIIEENTKYKDIYIQTGTDNSVTNYDTNKGKYGDAVYEISAVSDKQSWNYDYFNFPLLTAPFFIRGGSYRIAASTGTFAFDAYSGIAYYNIGFRVCLAF